MKSLAFTLCLCLFIFGTSYGIEPIPSIKLHEIIGGKTAAAAVVNDAGINVANGNVGNAQAMNAIDYANIAFLQPQQCANIATQFVPVTGNKMVDGVAIFDGFGTAATNSDSLGSTQTFITSTDDISTPLRNVFNKQNNLNCRVTSRAVQYKAANAIQVNNANYGFSNFLLPAGTYVTFDLDAIRKEFDIEFSSLMFKIAAQDINNSNGVGACPVITGRIDTYFDGKFGSGFAPKRGPATDATINFPPSSQFLTIVASGRSVGTVAQKGDTDCLIYSINAASVQTKRCVGKSAARIIWYTDEVTEHIATFTNCHRISVSEAQNAASKYYPKGTNLDFDPKDIKFVQGSGDDKRGFTSFTVNFECKQGKTCKICMFRACTEVKIPICQNSGPASVSQLAATAGATKGFFLQYATTAANVVAELKSIEVVCTQAVGAGTATIYTRSGALSTATNQYFTYTVNLGQTSNGVKLNIPLRGITPLPSEYLGLRTTGVTTQYLIVITNFNIATNANPAGAAINALPRIKLQKWNSVTLNGATFTFNAPGVNAIVHLEETCILSLPQLAIGDNGLSAPGSLQGKGLNFLSGNLAASPNAEALTCGNGKLAFSTSYDNDFLDGIFGSTQAGANINVQTSSNLQTSPLNTACEVKRKNADATLSQCTNQFLAYNSVASCGYAGPASLQSSLGAGKNFALKSFLPLPSNLGIGFDFIQIAIQNDVSIVGSEAFFGVRAGANAAGSVAISTMLNGKVVSTVAQLDKADNFISSIFPTSDFVKTMQISTTQQGGVTSEHGEAYLAGNLFATPTSRSEQAKGQQFISVASIIGKGTGIGIGAKSKVGFKPTTGEFIVDTNVATASVPAKCQFISTIDSTNAFIDGVFQPSGETQINSKGLKFTFPTNQCSTEGTISSNSFLGSEAAADLSMKNNAGVVVNLALAANEAVGMPGIAGFTLDLFAIRKYHGVRLTSTSGFFGAPINCGANRAVPFILIDGIKQGASGTNVNCNANAMAAAFPIVDAHYLTIAAGSTSASRRALLGNFRLQVDTQCIATVTPQIIATDNGDNLQITFTQCFPTAQPLVSKTGNIVIHSIRAVKSSFGRDGAFTTWTAQVTAAPGSLCAFGICATITTGFSNQVKSPTYSSVVNSMSPTDYFKFDEVKKLANNGLFQIKNSINFGVNLAISSAATRAAVIAGLSAVNSGIEGTSLVMNGAGGTKTISSQTSSRAVRHDISIIFWVKTTAGNNVFGNIVRGLNTAGNSLVVTVNHNTQEIRVLVGGVTLTAKIEAGRWNFIAIRISRSQRYSICVNARNCVIHPGKVNPNVFFGYVFEVAEASLQYMLDEFAVFHHELSLTALERLYASAQVATVTLPPFVQEKIANNIVVSFKHPLASALLVGDVTCSGCIGNAAAFATLVPLNTFSFNIMPSSANVPITLVVKAKNLGLTTAANVRLQSESHSFYIKITPQKKPTSINGLTLLNGDGVNSPVTPGTGLNLLTGAIVANQPLPGPTLTCNVAKTAVAVGANSFINAVFIPDGGKTDQHLTTGGVLQTFTFGEDTNCQSICGILIQKDCQSSAGSALTLDGSVESALFTKNIPTIFMHTNSGFTYDLYNIRRAQRVKMTSFTFEVSLHQTFKNINQNAFFYAILDGTQKVKVQVGPQANDATSGNNGQPYSVAISDTARFLSVAVTQVGGFGSGDILLINPQFQIDQSCSPSSKPTIIPEIIAGAAGIKIEFTGCFPENPTAVSKQGNINVVCVKNPTAAGPGPLYTKIDCTVSVPAKKRSTDATNGRGVICIFGVCVTVGGGFVAGDPHFMGLNGAKFDFQGTSGNIYNLFSTPTIEIRAKMNQLLLPSGRPFEISQFGSEIGLYMTEIGISFANSDTTIRIASASATNPTESGFLYINNQQIQNPSLAGSIESFMITNKVNSNKLMLEWKKLSPIEATKLGSPFANQHDSVHYVASFEIKDELKFSIMCIEQPFSSGIFKRFLDFSITPITQLNEQSTSGIIGSTAFLPYGQQWNGNSISYVVESLFTNNN